MGATSPIHAIRYPGGGDTAKGLAVYYEDIALDVDNLLPVPASSAPSSPGLGTIWYDTATGQAFIYDGSAWQPIGPLGDVGNATGPSGNTDFSTSASACSVSVPVVAGRVYRVEGYVLGAQVTNTGTPTVFVEAGSTELCRPMSGNSYVANAAVAYSGYARGLYLPSSTATVSFGLHIQDAGGAGAVFRVAASTCYIAVEDCGLA